MSETSPTAPVGTPAAAPPKPAAAPAAPVAAALPVETEKTWPPKIKVRAPRQRACDEKDAKGKYCFGHLKRYFDYPKEIAALVGGPHVELYRCEFCKTLYKPNMAEMSQSYTLRT